MSAVDLLDVQHLPSRSDICWIPVEFIFLIEYLKRTSEETEMPLETLSAESGGFLFHMVDAFYHGRDETLDFVLLIEFLAEMKSW